MNEYCIENERIASDYLGKSYLMVPRVILDQLSSEILSERQQGQLHLLLFSNCLYMDGCMKLQGRKVSCRKGEYVGTQEELARLIGIHITTLGHLIRKMVDQKLITVNRIKDGSRIRVNGYVEFTTPTANTETPPKEKEMSLSQQLAAAKKQLGGRQMNYDDVTI